MSETILLDLQEGGFSEISPGKKQKKYTFYFK